MEAITETEIYDAIEAHENQQKSLTHGNTARLRENMRYCSVCLANALLKNKLYNPHEHNDHLTSEERKFYAGERVRVCESVRDIVTTIYS